MDKILQSMMDLVRQAGEMILDTEEIKIADCKEGTSNYATSCDIMVQTFLIKGLSKLLPEATFVGEESKEKTQVSDDSYTFIIDPIDGTTNFMNHFMLSAISVGLSYCRRMVLAVVYNPFTEEMFYALEGKGAYLNQKRLQVLNRTLKDGVVCFDAAPYHPLLRKSSYDLAHAVSYHAMDMRMLGCAALGICYVACNRCVAYFTLNLCVWDYAAAMLILKEAGGVLSDLTGEDMNFRTDLSLVATVVDCQDEIRRLAAQERYKSFITAVKKWSEKTDDIDGVILVGSYARGTYKEDSDIDLCILTAKKAELVENQEFTELFGEIEKKQTEYYGACTSVRVWYRNGLEAEFGLVEPSWIKEPLDSGTCQVLRDGYVVITDKKGYFTDLKIG